MRWIRSKDLQHKLSLSATGLKVLIDREPGFPKPIQVSERHVVFDEEAVEKWMRTKVLTNLQEVT